MEKVPHTHRWKLQQVTFNFTPLLNHVICTYCDGGWFDAFSDIWRYLMSIFDAINAAVGAQPAPMSTVTLYGSSLF